MVAEKNNFLTALTHANLKNFASKIGGQFAPVQGGLFERLLHNFVVNHLIAQKPNSYNVDIFGGINLSSYTYDGYYAQAKQKKHPQIEGTFAFSRIKCLRYIFF